MQDSNLPLKPRENEASRAASLIVDPDVDLTSELAEFLRAYQALDARQRQAFMDLATTLLVKQVTGVAND